MLDKISLKIMSELCRDGRLSNARLAEMLDISEITVARKIESLLNEGVIVIRGIPNPAKMGFKASALIGLKVDLRRIDDISRQLMDNIHINLVVNCFGRFDILLIVYFQEWTELQRFVKEELSRIKGINHIDTFLISEARKRNKKVYPDTSLNQKMEMLDDLDRELVKELVKNGRPSYAQLAERYKVSVSTISRRINALLKNDLMQVIAIPDPSKLGYMSCAFVLLKVEMDKASKICDELATYPEVTIIMRLMNEYDILFGVDTTDQGALYSFFKEKIAFIDGILSSETFIRGNFLYFSADAMLLPSLK